MRGARRNDPTFVYLDRGYCDGMTDALRGLFNRSPGPATDADRPPVSVFPMTRAAREALRLARGIR